MARRFRVVGLVVAAGAIALMPAGAQAMHHGHHGKAHAKHGSKSHSCAQRKKAFVVNGALVSLTRDDAATTATDETSVTLTVRRANRHARRSGELVDTDASTPGTQVTYVAASDPFRLKLSGYDTGQSPDVGDKVRVKGKIAFTRRRCAAAGTSVEDRYGDVNVRRVKLIQTD
jgi:hypothetical protein